MAANRGIDNQGMSTIRVEGTKQGEYKAWKYEELC